MRRKSRANHNKNPCEISPVPSTDKAGEEEEEEEGSTRKHNRIIFAISVCLYASFFLWKRFQFPAPLENWNNVYIDRQVTQPAGTFLIQDTLNFQKGRTEWGNTKILSSHEWSTRKTLNRSKTVDRMSTVALLRSSQKVLSLICYREQYRGSDVLCVEVFTLSSLRLWSGSHPSIIPQTVFERIYVAAALSRIFGIHQKKKKTRHMQFMHTSEQYFNC